ncbi:MULTISPECIES: endonuclease/exonuclease/phosphatase family protein [unclassified Roseovarius]|uniref:endonuclease/exonuclease/phosphatase family protein n=1 Tax=unclassified Roseovarius TaxID=2614913 RepID=UPI00273DED62|nr:endonuclease/exonuclease/phosphatase family protein [Roseovarius sp. MMSF_3350]
MVMQDVVAATGKSRTDGLRLRCASWNVHRAKGADGRVDPDRVRAAIAGALVPEAPDVLALQEADAECRPHESILDMAGIASDSGLVWQHEDPEMRWGPQSDGFLGTILFLHPRLEVGHRDVIDLPGHCHRGAVVVEAQVDGLRVRIMSMHLSLSQPLRVVQMRIVGQYLRRRPIMQTIMMGDFNEWRPWGGLMFNGRLVGRRFHGAAPRSFPAHRPLLPLDRILTDRAGAVSDVRVIATDQTRAASDHLPIRGEVLVSASD